MDDEQRRRRVLACERAAAVALVAIGLAVVVRAESLTSVSAFARPGALPAHGALIIGGGVLALASAAWALQAFRRDDVVLSDDAGRLRHVLFVFALLVAAAWSAHYLGLLAAAALAYIGLLLFYRDRNWIFIGVSVVAYVLILHYGLEVGLRVPLPRSPYLPLPF